MRGTVGKILLLITSIALTFFIAEWVIRITYPQDTGSVINIYEEDPFLKYRLQANKTASQVAPDFNVKYITNSAGFRDREYKTLKEFGTCRILAVGDSFSVGHGIPQNKIYLEVLENLLNSRALIPFVTKWEIINTSVGGYHLYHYIKSVQKYTERYSIDIVLAGFYIGNDFGGFDEEAKMTFSDGYLAGYESKSKIFQKKDTTIQKSIRNWLRPLRRFFSVNSHLYVLCRKALYSILKKIGLVNSLHTDNLSLYKSASNKKFYADTEKYVANLAAFARLKNVSLLFLLIPQNIQVYDDLWRKSVEASGYADKEVAIEEPNNRLKQILEKFGVLYIDMLHLMRKHPNESYYFLNDGHWSENGHAFAARHLWDYFSKNLTAKTNTKGGCGLDRPN